MRMGKFLSEGAKFTLTIKRLINSTTHPNRHKKRDDYGQYLAGNVNLNGVIEVLCNEGVKWKMNKGVPMSFKASAMKSDHKLCIIF